MRLEELDPELLSILLSRRVINESTNCWIWTDGVTHNNHAQFNYKGSNQAVARWIMGVKPGEKINVNHKNECHNPQCFNPEHLYKGTQSDNIKDAIKLGTFISNFGEAKRQKTHCPQGHEYNENNKNSRGDRICKICMKKANIKYQIKKGNESCV